MSSRSVDDERKIYNRSRIEDPIRFKTRSRIRQQGGQLGQE